MRSFLNRRIPRRERHRLPPIDRPWALLGHNRCVRQACLYLLLAAVCAADDSTARRQQYLNDLRRILAPSYRNDTTRLSATDKTFEDWQERTGELPPDFEAMPSNPFLPDPLEGVKSTADWQARRKWIREQYEHWIIGKFPPAPDNLRGIVTSTRKEDGVEIRDVRLEFGPDHKGILHLQLVMPGTGQGPFPVFLTNHPRNRPWMPLRYGADTSVSSSMPPTRFTAVPMMQMLSSNCTLSTISPESLGGPGRACGPWIIYTHCPKSIRRILESPGTPETGKWR